MAEQEIRLDGLTIVVPTLITHERRFTEEEMISYRASVYGTGWTGRFNRFICRFNEFIRRFDCSS